jgi:hypothetical protein
MKNIDLENSAGVLHADPDVAVFNGPIAEELARTCGILDPLRQLAQAEVARTGSAQRVLATYLVGQDYIGAVFWGGFADPKENGIVCCVGHCSRQEDMPIVLRKLSEFFSCALNQHPSPWTLN